MDSPAPRLRLAGGLALVILAGLLAAAPAVAQRAPRAAGSAPWKRIPVPADPAEVKGTWTIGGETFSMSADEYYKLQVLMTKLNASVRRAVPDRVIWTHIGLVAEAKAYGLKVTEAELNAALEADDEELYGGLLARWKSQEVSEAEAREHEREKLLITKLKNMFLNNQRVGTKQAFDAFKRDRLRYKLAYVRFAAEDYMDEVKAQPLDDLALQKFWSENIMIQNKFRERAKLSADIVYLDRDRLSMEEAMRLSGGKAVTRESALAYFQRNKANLMRNFPPAKRHLIQIGEDTKLEDIVSPFSILEESIKKQLLVEGVLDRAYEDAKAAGKDADVVKIAEKYQLGSLRVENIDQAQATVQLRPFGFNAWTTINQTPEGQVSSQILSEQNRNWFYIVRDKAPSRLPKFDDIKEEVRRNYYERAAYDKARDRARLANSKLEQMVADSIAAEKQVIEARAQKEAEARILERGLSKPAEINREKLKSSARARQEVEKLRANALPRYFDSWVKTQELKLRESDYFEFKQMRVNRNEIKDPKERALSFFTTNFYIRNLEEGQVTSILLDDPVTRSLYVAKLVEKKDPELSSMSAVDLMQSRMKQTELTESRFMQRWQFNALQRRLNIEVNK